MPDNTSSSPNPAPDVSPVAKVAAPVPVQLTFKQYLVTLALTGLIGLLTAYITTKRTASGAVVDAVNNKQTQQAISNQVSTAVSDQPLAPIVGEVRTFAFGGGRNDEVVKRLRASGWLECAGQDLTKNDYPALYKAIGESWGSSSPGNNFYVPDMRGMFLRGWSHGATTDPDAATRTAAKSNGASGNTVGSFQPEKVGSHTHPYSYRAEGLLFQYAHNDRSTKEAMGNPRDVPGTTSEPQGATENRPKNVSVLYCINVGRPVLETTPDGSR
jgi:microcystin-dependent protein